VGKVQTALKQLDFYEGVVDDDFGNRTLRAVLDYQTAIFGPAQDDGIVGPLTAGSLQIANWPRV
jgi:peptidoglycan hydrolase-like protein with peptidoglycan-binding domain